MTNSIVGIIATEATRCVLNKGMGFCFWFFFNFLSVGARCHCPSVSRLLKWNTSPSEFSGCCQVILWNVGYHWVEGAGRLREGCECKQKNNNNKIKVNLSATSLVIPDRTGRESHLRIKKCVCVCVCLCVCMNWCFYTQDDTPVIFPWNRKDYATFSFSPFFATNLIDELSFLFLFFFLFFLLSKFKMLLL